MPLMSLEPPAKSCSGVRPLGGEPGATASWVPELKHQDIKGEDGSGRGLSSCKLSLLLGSLLLVLQLGLGVWPKQPRELCLEEAMYRLPKAEFGLCLCSLEWTHMDTHGYRAKTDSKTALEIFSS